jgi:hypothetical protein
VTARPYLSVVATARNDDHGGDLLHRMQLFVNGLVSQCERHRLHAELVLVEWNPPSERPHLAHSLIWPESERCAIRVIQVPGDVHSRFAHSDRLPLFQMIAKNVGIRRARGQFILATNVDVLFSHKLMEFLAARKLKAGVVYRTDRYDVSADIPLEATLDEQLRICDQTVIRVCGRAGTLELSSGEFYRISIKLSGLPWWLSVPAFALERVAGKVARGSLGVLRQLVPSAEGTLSKDNDVRGSVLPQSRDGAGRLRFSSRLQALVDLAKWQRTRVHLHTNASGDFTLMSSSDWARVRGYPELELFSMHIDGLLLYQAHYAGIKEKLIGARLYHVDHTAGFKPDAQSLKALSERLERGAIPQITDEQFMAWARRMHSTRAPIMFNADAWGLAAEDFHESTPGARAGRSMEATAQ